MTRRLALVLALLAAPVLAAPAMAADNPLQPSPSWDDMRSAVTGTEAEPVIDAAILDLEAPLRATTSMTFTGSSVAVDRIVSVCGR